MDRVLEALRQAQEAHPHQRAGQILFNATNGEDTFYWSDDQLAEAILRYVGMVK